jgi:YggT family protein
MISLLATIAYFVLYVFFIALWLRFIFDWVRVLAKNFTPKGPLLVVAELSYSVTDKPLTAVRRFVPQIRFGGAAIDLGRFRGFPHHLRLRVWVFGFESL